MRHFGKFGLNEKNDSYGERRIRLLILRENHAVLGWLASVVGLPDRLRTFVS